MKQKILEALKRDFKDLGLSEATLQLHAELLAGLGTVNDDNLTEIVKKQEAYLKGLQSENDKRVSTAVETARKKFTDDADAAAKKAAEEAAKKKAEEEAAKKAAEEKAAKEKAEQERIAKLEGFEKQFEEFKLEQAKQREEEKAAFEKRIADLIKKNKSTEDSLAATKQELADKAAAQEKAARLAMIEDKAKKLGIPETRIKEGFVIADDLDESGIDSYLNTVATNIKTTMLPNHGQRGVTLPEGKPSQQDLDAIAASMLNVR